MELYHVTHWYAKANDSTRKIIIKIKNHHELSIGIKHYVFLIKYYHFPIKEWKLKKIETLAANLHDKKIKSQTHFMQSLKQALNQKLVLKKLSQEVWLKP